MTKERLKEIIDEIILRKTIDENQHWRINLALSKGYPGIKRNNKSYRILRLIAAYYHGLDLDNPKQFACHKNECNDKTCISPEHIYVGDATKNRYDALELGITNGNAAKTHCSICGLSYDKENTIWLNRGTVRNCRNCTRRRARKTNQEYRKRKKLEKEVRRINKINQNKIV